ncbi:MAG: hypothetical protein DIU84_06675 [Bacillota bacterium]|nr:hypothetical protein [Bacillota bacterium]REJ35891.1 MAG: hypothetical protein DIU84_06675 [Bacillota bacterium]
MTIERRQYPEIDIDVFRAQVHGLTVLVVPRPGFQRRYAAFSTRYGGNDLEFVPRGGTEPVRTPSGIAHFLEHQLFDRPEGSVLQRLSALGASPNAYTSSTSTVYYVSAVDGFEQALDILLDFVQEPAFTEAGVAKEQGIIEQEIRIYQDYPHVQVYEDLMQALYQAHPARVPVIGTVEDIRRITVDLLNTCHRTFYHPHNMLLAVIGDVDPAAVVEQVERDLAGRSYGPPEPVRRVYPDEPEPVARPESRRAMATAEAYAAVGFKLAPPVPVDGSAPAPEAQRRVLLLQLALDALIGPASAFYQRLYDEGVFTDAFGYNVEVQPGAAHVLVSGRTNQPGRFCEEVLERLRSAAGQGVDPADFERVRRARLGSFLSVLDDADALNGLLVRDRLLGFDFLRTAQLLRDLDAGGAGAVLAELGRDGRAAVAVVEPKEDGRP